MKQYTLTINGVEGLNEIMAAVEKRMIRGAELDQQCEDRGFKAGTVTRRALRRTIIADANILLELWDMFEQAHVNQECEHDGCKVNDLSVGEIMHRVSSQKRNVRHFLETANGLDQEAGEEVLPDPAPEQEDPMAILSRIFGYTSPN